MAMYRNENIAKNMSKIVNNTPPFRAAHLAAKRNAADNWMSNENDYTAGFSGTNKQNTLNDFEKEVDKDSQGFNNGGEIPEGYADEPSVLKSVYCNYRGYLIVYDVHGEKVHELSGELTFEKYEEIERRSVKDITEFEGLEDYRCIACELKKKEHEKQWDNQYDPLGLPIKSNGIPNGSPLGKTASKQPWANGAVNPPPKGIPTQKPSNPLIGEVYVDVNLNQIGVWMGTSWIYKSLPSPAGSGTKSSKAIKIPPSGKTQQPPSPQEYIQQQSDTELLAHLMSKMASQKINTTIDGDYEDPFQNVLNKMENRKIQL